MKMRNPAHWIIAIGLLMIAGAYVYLDESGASSPTMGGPSIPGPAARVFFEAVARDQREQVLRMLADDPSLATLSFPEMGSALHVAAAQGLSEMAMILLDHKADLEARGQWGGTPLHWAAWLGNQATAKLLIERGANVEARCGAFQSTPMLWAAHGSSNVQNPNGDYIGVCQSLLDAGGKADTANGAGISAVALAAPPVARFLLEHGAKPAPPATQPMPPLLLPRGRNAV